MGSSDVQIANAKKSCPKCDFSAEQPQHTVFLDEYQIGKYEITNRQYAQCVKAGICAQLFSGRGNNKDLDPVGTVTWSDAKTYCEWAGGRLPTEAEWEKAARGPDGRIYPWGNSIDCSLSNFWPRNSNICIGNKTEIGIYKDGKSPYGLLDMSGNVWEWVNDWYSDTYYQVSPFSNPLGPSSGTDHVLRGGSFINDEIQMRSSSRAGADPYSVFDTWGFRCARDVP